MTNVLVVGYYNHCNLGDEQYKHSIHHIITHLPTYKPKTVEFVDCDKLADLVIPENCVVLLGGGDVLNNYFLDKINQKFIDMENRPKIIAFSVGIPYNSIFLQPENLKKLDIFDHIYLRTQQDIPLFSQFYIEKKLSYLPDASCFLPDACALPKTPSSYFTSLNKPKPSPSTNDMYKKLYSGLYSLHKTKKIININLCRHIYHPDYKQNYELIVRELARFMEELTKKGYYLVLLPFNTKPTAEDNTDDTNCENDILIHNDVLRYIKNHSNIINIDYALSLGEILSLYPLFYMSLPMRFHGTLFSINAAVPMIPIYTTKKIKNILLDIGWTHEYVFEKNEKDLPISFNSKKMMMTFLDCVRHHTRGKILLKSQFENFKNYYDGEKCILEARIFSPVKVNMITPLNIINRTPEGRPVQCSRATLLVNELYQAPLKEGHPDSNLHGCKERKIMDIIPPPPNLSTKLVVGTFGPLPPEESDNLYDTYFKSPLAHSTKFSENPIIINLDENDEELIKFIYNRLQVFSLEHNVKDFRDVVDPTLKNVIVCVTSYFLTEQIDSQYNHGLLEKMFSSTYDYENEWKWVLQHHKNGDKKKIVLPENHQGIFNIGYIDQNDQSGVHRSGWKHVFENLVPFNNSNAPILLDLYIDRTFHWKREIYKQIGVIPYRKPWIGFVHHTFDQTFSEYNNSTLFDCPEFLESLPMCHGIIVLSNYLKCQFDDEFIKREMTRRPIYVLTHPTEIRVPQFDMELFLKNQDKKLLHIGGWLRNIFSFYQFNLCNRFMVRKSELLDTPRKGCVPNLRELLQKDRKIVKHTIRKVALKGKYMNNYYPPIKLGEKLLKALSCLDVNEEEKETKFCSQTNLQNNWLKHLAEYLINMDQHTDIMEAVDNKTYDALLTNNLVFLNLIDGSAVNTLIECIVRNTPVFINKHPAVVEILGRHYPLYYNNPEDINRMLENPICLKLAHEHMKKIKKSPYDINEFIVTLQNIITKINLYNELL